MSSSRYDGPVPGDPSWEAADIRGDAWVDDSRAQMQAEAEERLAAAEGEELTAAGYFWHRAADGSTVTDGWSPDWRGGEQMSDEEFNAVEDAYIYETEFQGQADDEAEVEA